MNKDYDGEREKKLNDIININQVNLIRISEDDECITQFPRKLRLILAEMFYRLSSEYSNASNRTIIKKSISFLLKKDIKKITELKELFEKLKIKEFRRPILVYLHSLLRITQYVMSLNDSKQRIIIKNVVSELSSSGLDLGLSKSYLKEFISNLIKEFRKSLDDFSLRIKNSILTYSDLKRIAKSKKGKLLSTKEDFDSAKTEGYISHTEFLWVCEKGHKFWLTPAKINQGSWCPEEREKKPWTYERLKKLAIRRGCEENNISGELLTSLEEYRKLKEITFPNRAKFKWSCGIEGHPPWLARPDSILYGSWCPACASNTPLTYNDMVSMARKRGIESIGKPGKFCTSKKEFEKYSSKSTTHFLWQCGEKHKPWLSTYSNIRLGRWCPKCAEGTSERIARYFFESIFDLKFPKSSPKWLKRLTNHRLELDGYNERLRLAFEFNGIQHYIPIYGLKKLEIQQEFDYLKKWASEKEGVTLIIIPYDFDGRADFVDYDKMQDFIIDEYEKKTGKKLPNFPQFDYRTRNVKRLDEF
ncbi:MAG: hypothetical protein ACQERB_06775 [Promethearchaeati archaeon]